MKYRKSEYVVFVVTLIMISSVTILISFKDKENSQIMKNLSNYVFVPTEKLFLYIGYHISGITGYLEDINELKRENDKIYESLKLFELERERMEAIKIENEVLRKVLELKDQKPEFKFNLAEIIAKDPINYHKTFTINKGKKDGVEFNQTVLSVNYVLLGRIYEVGSNYSKVLTIFSEKNALGGRVIRSLEPGIIENDGCSFLYKMTAISKFSDIILGDLIETSGLGGIYPEGILIGKVSDIKTEISSIAQTAIIEPSEDLNSVVRVLIKKKS